MPVRENEQAFLFLTFLVVGRFNYSTPEFTGYPAVSNILSSGSSINLARIYLQ